MKRKKVRVGRKHGIGEPEMGEPPVRYYAWRGFTVSDACRSTIDVKTDHYADEHRRYVESGDRPIGWTPNSVNEPHKGRCTNVDSYAYQ